MPETEIMSFAHLTDFAGINLTRLLACSDSMCLLVLGLFIVVPLVLIERAMISALFLSHIQ